MKVSKIGIVEDSPALATSLREALAGEFPGAQVLAWTSAAEFVGSLGQLAAEQLPQVVLMDIGLETPHAGIEATRWLAQAHPGIQAIMLTCHDDDEAIFEAFKGGAVGYLIKEAPVEAVARAIIEVAEGGTVIAPGVARRAIAFFQWLAQEKKLPQGLATRPNPPANGSSGPLSDRELEVLGLIGAGQTYQQVADRLCVSLHTIKTHMNNIFKKLQVANKLQALQKAKLSR
ncbi:MAG: response regulator transcription factor [Bernardetiaceae bacterium]|jgi:DNA-binding NarL/FixJ family response regulator|nr:response regulator transcription factor [Bernardetiaceae bacterium]